MFVLPAFQADFPEKTQKLRFSGESSLASIPVTLEALEDKFQKTHLDFTCPITISFHDLFNHILGGGITTPKGEVFGELISFILTTSQEKGFDVSSKLKPNITLPSKEACVEVISFWENYYDDRERMLPHEHLSKDEIDECYVYGASLLESYIKRWGIKKGGALLGAFGPERWTVEGLKGYQDRVL